MSTIEIIEAILRDEFPDIKNIKANIIANRILDAIEDMETERQWKHNFKYKNGGKFYESN